MDSIAVILNQRQETLRYRFEYYMGNEDAKAGSINKK
jgi:hypothetical protein